MLPDYSAKDYKAFVFVHTALSPIQNHVQRSHALVELFVKYRNRKDELGEAATEVLNEWARDHKTIVIRDGGISKNMHTILEILQIVCPVVSSPYAFFSESNDFMEGLLTSVAFVLDRNAPQTTVYEGFNTSQLLEVAQTELKGDGLSQTEAYGILVALIDSTRPAR